MLLVDNEPAPAGLEWYEVKDPRNPFHLWIVERRPPDDDLKCTCESTWCAHQAAVAAFILAAEARMDAADRLDYARGQF